MYLVSNEMNCTESSFAVVTIARRHAEHWSRMCILRDGMASDSKETESSVNERSEQKKHTTARRTSLLFQCFVNLFSFLQPL